jgi:creatinine amidohydrolase
MYWRDLTRLEIDGLDKKTPVVLPLAAIEQHGDHLPVDTDLKIGEHFCQHLDKAIGEEVLIVPPVAVTCSGHHLDFAGTLSVTHKVFFDYVSDLINSIIHQGFLKIILFNSHGGNQAIGQAIIESSGLLHPKAHLLMISWWKLASEKFQEISEAGFGGRGHACELETSVIAAADEKMVRKDKIKHTPLAKMPKWARGDLLQAAPVGYHRTMREWTGDGVFGNPELFSAAKGRKITAVVVESMTQIIRDIKNW